MRSVDVVVQSDCELSIRARQVCGMFDCPPQQKQRLSWKAELPIDERTWNIGLIVGPSGSGKTLCAKHLWPNEYGLEFNWQGSTLIDCFDSSLPIEEITTALGSVGFSTIPAWLRPFHVLSNGEKFRAEIARRFLEEPGVIVIDEFTSVVDRQVAVVACHAVQKFVRKKDRQLVAVTCHEDVIDWLQPDWIFEPAERTFRWRCLQRRPEIQLEMARVPYEAWQVFAPFHYLTAELNRAATCFALWANGNIASFMGVLHRPHALSRNLKATSRLVTLPDWQGLGLIFVLMNSVSSAYKACGYRMRFNTAHPGFARSTRSAEWRCDQIIGTVNQKNLRSRRTDLNNVCSRFAACFEYIGPAMNKQEASRLLTECVDG